MADPNKRIVEFNQDIDMFAIQVDNLESRTEVVLDTLHREIVESHKKNLEKLDAAQRELIADIQRESSS